MELGNVSTAMVTPFNEAGEVDYDRASALIEHLLANGTDSLVVCGTTGEAPTLSQEEKERLIAFTVEQVNKRVPVIAGTGSNNTAESISNSQQAEKLGVDGIMIVAPYYNKPCQEGIIAHFTAIAHAVNVPMLMYNIPGRTGINMTAETTIALSNVKNIVAMKEASGNLDQMAMIIEGVTPGFKVYSGDDGLTVPLLAAGGDGIVSVAAHIVGNEMQQMVQDFKAGRVAEAASMHRKLLPVVHALFATSNPVPLKYALNQKLQVAVGDVRLPLIGYGAVHPSFDSVWEAFQANK